MRKVVKMTMKLCIIGSLFLGMGIQSDCLSKELDFELKIKEERTAYTSEEYGTFKEEVKDTKESHLTTWKKTAKKIFQDKQFVIVTTSTGLIALSVGLYYIYCSYDPDVASEFLESSRIYDPQLGFFPDWLYHQRSEHPVPNSQCYHSCLNYSTDYWEHSAFSNDHDHGPGYMFVKEVSTGGKGVEYKGNFTQWIEAIKGYCGCDPEKMSEYFTSILNGTKANPDELTCFPNSDNQTKCCVSAWGWHTWDKWYPHFPFSNLTARVVSASGDCAQFMEYGNWQLKMGLFGGFGSLVALTPAIMGVATYFM